MVHLNVIQGFERNHLAHLFAADAQRFRDDLDEPAVAQAQFGARKVQTHLTAEVLSHQLHTRKPDYRWEPLART